MNVYDHIDMRNSYNNGFWTGAISSGVTVLFMCFLIGLYLA